VWDAQISRTPDVALDVPISEPCRINAIRIVMARSRTTALAHEQTRNSALWPQPPRCAGLTIGGKVRALSERALEVDYADTAFVLPASGSGVT